MLKETLRHFYELADEARQKFGDNAPKVTDQIIDAAFPETTAAAEIEGCDRMLRDGVKSAVSKYIRKPSSDERQRSFNDISVEVMPYVEPLGSVAYFVPTSTGGDYVSVPDLCHNAEMLRSAWQYMQQMADYNQQEADRLKELLQAVESQ